MRSPAHPPDAGPRRAWRSLPAWLVLIGVLASGLWLDLGMKHWAFSNVADEPVGNEILQDPNRRIPPHDPVPVVPKLLSLHLVENDGAVFGIGSNQRMFFIAFTMAALIAALVVFGRWTSSRAWLAHLAIGLILAGGLGNLYDRIQLTVVRDYLHILPGWTLPFGWHYPRLLGGGEEVFPWVFNAADVMLLLGMGLLLVHMNAVDRRRKHAQAIAAETIAKPTQPESA